MTQENYWKGKKAKIEINKDGKRLIYTATIIEVDSMGMTFKDRDNQIFAYNHNLIKQMQELH